MTWGNVIFLDQFRTSGTAEEDDIELLARKVCEVVAKAYPRSVPFDEIARQATLSEESAIVGAAYAEARGWATFADCGVMLTSDGLKIFSENARSLGWPLGHPVELHAREAL